MDKWQRRTVYYSLGLSAIMVVYAVLYFHGMRIFEGRSISFLHALQVVVETFTTTGFGSDSPWATPEMNAFVIVMDLTGVALIFLAFPALVFPLFEDIFSTTVPTSLDDELSDHVVICTYTARSEALIAELDSWGIEYVIVEPDRETAVDLFEDGYRVVRADPDSVEGLAGARLGSARALVSDVSDQVDASIVLTAREVAEDVRIISVVEDPTRSEYHRLAGADQVLSPRSLLGSSLASKVTTSVSTSLDGEIELGEDFEIAELSVHRGSRLVGKTLAESGIRERSGVNVIGAWFRGQFETPPDPGSTITNGTILLVTGQEDQLETLKDLTRSAVRRFESGETIVVGYGQVGRAAVAALEEHDLSYTIVDHEDMDDVDVIGEAAEPETLRRAGVESARSVILALPNDTTTEFATLVIRDMSPQTEVIARVDETRNIKKMYRAGADYVLSLGTVTGRMVASTVIEEEEVLSFENQVDVVRTRAPSLSGRTVGNARVRSRTKCTVVSIERDGEILTEVGPDVRIQPGDELIIAGTDEGIRRFNELFG
jgi:Trk K+ transport system NAD-binding subunit